MLIGTTGGIGLLGLSGMTGLKHGCNLCLLMAGVLAMSATTAAAEDARSLRSSPSVLQQNHAVGVIAADETERIRARLAERGMQEVWNLRREGGIYRADALWYGETVDVHIDAATGEIKQPTRLSGAQIEVLLRDSGWHHIGQAKRAGDRFDIRAQRDGRAFDLNIDAQTGKILETGERTNPQRDTLTSEGLPQR